MNPPSTPTVDSSTVLAAVLDEFTDRLNRGEQPDLEEYARKHPGLEGVLRQMGSVLRLARPAREPKLSLAGLHVGREVGRGGMGVVYEAVEEALDRRVAVKVLPPHVGADPARLERFRREAHAAARLHHSNIVPVFGVGSDGDTHYYLMQFIEARTSSAAGGPAFEIDEAVRLASRVADALHYAHERGVLHRDVKPSNILIDESGTPWVADFGLAKLAEAAELTETGVFVGTPRYAAPEQQRGEADQRTDVYALGVTLYEWLTGRRAFDADDRVQLARQVAETDPPRPRLHNPAIPRDLETVVLKAIAKEPARRYQSAAELRDDLLRFTRGEPVRARRVGPLGRAWRWSRRNPIVAGLLAGLLLVFALGAAGVTWKWREAVANFDEAERNRKDAENNFAHYRAEWQRAEDRAREARGVRTRLGRTFGQLLEGAEAMRRLVPAKQLVDVRSRPGNTVRQFEKTIYAALRAASDLIDDGDPDPAVRREKVAFLLHAGGRPLLIPYERQDLLARAVRTAARLAADFPDDPESHLLHARALTALGDNAGARAVLARVRERWPDRPEVADPGTAVEKAGPEDIYKLALAQKVQGDSAMRAQDYQTAAGHYRALLQIHDRHPDDVKVRDLARGASQSLASTLVILKDHAGAAEAVARNLEVSKEQAFAPRIAATLYAGCIKLASADAALPESERKALADRYSAAALAQLREAVRRGDALMNPRWLQSDPHLAPLRALPEFAAVVAEAEKAAPKPKAGAKK